MGSMDTRDFEFPPDEILDEHDRMEKRVEDLERHGHPPHCAARQVWGDGECECDLYKKGYDPYGWMKEKANEPSHR